MIDKKHYENYSDALREVLLPRIKEIVDKEKITLVECSKAIEMLNEIQKALKAESFGNGLF